MHEYHAAEALVGALAGEGGAGVSVVRVRAAPVFSAEALQQAYEMLVAGTTLEGSRLLVEDLVMARDCDACGLAWEVSRDDVAGHLVVCPSCGSISGLGEGAGIEVVEVRYGTRRKAG